MRTLRARLDGGEVILADGAIGTLLLGQGLEPGACPESVNLRKPRTLEKIAARYVEAGAEMVQTNTFGGSPLKLAPYGLEERLVKINHAAVHAARRAVGHKAYVALSCGPCGQLLRPYGEADPGEVADGFRRQLGAAADAGVDMICIETMTDLAEALLALRAAREVAGELPISVAVTFDDTPRGFFTIMGNPLEQVASELGEAGADVIGSNCGNGSETMVRIAAALREQTALPLLIRPNAGLPRVTAEGTIYPENPEFMAEQCRALLPLGVGILGGCCGTTPEHVAALRRMIDGAPAGEPE
jgi:5-methyltetrahydrofolate--homocysteine methyltransferase